MPPQHVQQGVDGIGVAPVVVKGDIPITVNLGQVLHEPDLGPIDGPPTSGLSPPTSRRAEMQSEVTAARND